jgi:TetR/AcrR family transcriptional regulator
VPRPHRKRDAQATRARLLQAATREFARAGFAGARVDAIADRARTNKRMIYAYFGSKDGLYRAVLDAHLALAFAVDGPAPAAPRAQVERLLRAYFVFLSDHPDFVRLLAWEALSTEARSRRILLDRVIPALEPLHAVVGRGIAEGAFRRDLVPRELWMSANAFFLGYFIQEPLVEAIWEADLGTARARAATLQQFLRLLMDGIGAAPGGPVTPSARRRPPAGSR